MAPIRHCLFAVNILYYTNLYPESDNMYIPFQEVGDNSYSNIDIDIRIYFFIRIPAE